MSPSSMSGSASALTALLAPSPGSNYVIEETKALLAQSAQLNDLTRRQLDKILLAASQYPGTIPGVVNRRIEQEAKQSAVLDSFEFCMLKGVGEKCLKPITANEIDNIAPLVARYSRTEEHLGSFQASRTGPQAGLDRTS